MHFRRDEEIDGETLLWRRLTSPEWITPNSDGSRRVSSGAFKGKPADEDISVHICELTTLERVFSSRPFSYGVAEIRAKDAQGQGYTVTYDPDPEDVSHAKIAFHANYGQRKKRSKLIAQSAKLIERIE